MLKRIIERINEVEITFKGGYALCVSLILFYTFMALVALLFKIITN